MQALHRTRWTEDEYLAQELNSEVKHEFVNGEIIAMAGGTPAHNGISGNVIGALGNVVRGKGCTVFTSDQRIHVPATGLYTYPDASVLCGKAQLHARDKNALLNPLVLVEVLSEGTQDYDLGAKFGHYRSIPSLREVLFIAQSEPLCLHYRRIEPGQWLLTERREGRIEMPALGGAIDLHELYENIAQLVDVEPRPA